MQSPPEDLEDTDRKIGRGVEREEEKEQDNEYVRER